MTSSNQKITVLGGGAFGTSMAHLLAKKGLAVSLWAREKDVVDEINQKKKNTRFLKGADLCSFSAFNDVAISIKDSSFLLFAIPCQFLGPFLKAHKDLLPKKAIIVNLAKGVEIDSLQTPSQIFSSVLGKNVLSRYASVSGPTFSKELYQEMPSGAAVASQSIDTAKKVQQTLSQKFFRLYTVDDLLGVELGGALKNVMALGVGIADGLGFGLNTRAGLVTRCLHEMTELGVAMGAKPRTFSGLSGVGDLILTCTGDLSRNRQVGLRIGKGEKIKDIIKSMDHVAEGVSTAKAAYQLKEKHRTEMPNAEHVYKILYENMSPQDALMSVLSRNLKEEFSS